jgi:hypothetical protein
MYVMGMYLIFSRNIPFIRVIIFGLYMEYHAKLFVNSRQISQGFESKMFVYLNFYYFLFSNLSR